MTFEPSTPKSERAPRQPVAALGRRLKNVEMKPLRAKMLKRLGILVAVLGVAAVVIAVSPIGTVIGSIIEVTLKHRNLKVRSDTHEIGREMAALLHDPSLASDTDMFPNDKRMPARLRELKPVYLRIYKPRSAVLEFGGGFYHYGYMIEADGSSRYRMTCYGEEIEDTVDLGPFQYGEGEQAMDANRSSSSQPPANAPR